MKRLQILPVAEKEHEEAIEYVLNRFGSSKALEFLSEIDNTINAILANPSTYPLLEKGKPFRRILIRKEISIIYEEAILYKVGACIDENEGGVWDTLSKGEQEAFKEGLKDLEAGRTTSLEAANKELLRAIS